MKLYLAGPMRGKRFFNFPAFDEARDRLVAMGHEVVSPADLDRARGFDGCKCSPDDPCDKAPEGFDLDACILEDVAAVLACDGVVFLDGWLDSAGARAEYAAAEWRGKHRFVLLPFKIGGRPAWALTHISLLRNDSVYYFRSQE